MTQETPISEQDQQEIALFLARGITIPVQPKLLLEIDELVKQPRVTIKAVANLIAQDPGVIAAVFRIVNSPAFGLAKGVETMESAVSVLGLEQILTLVKCTMLRQSLGESTPVYEKFWERSSYIAQLAAAIARKQQAVCHIAPEHAYMAGLFFECGVVLLMQRFPEYCATFKVMHSAGWPALLEEDRLLDTDHAVVGYLVSRYWGLPVFISESIRHHHAMMAASAKARTLIAMLQMAMHMYNLRQHQPDETEWVTILPAVLLELGLDTDGQQEFEEEVFDSLVSVS